MLNKRGSLLVDAMMALLLIAFTLMVLVSSLTLYRQLHTKERRGFDDGQLYELVQEAEWLYDD